MRPIASIPETLQQHSAELDTLAGARGASRQLQTDGAFSHRLSVLP